MSDNKNDIDTDFEEKLAEIVGKKSRNRTNNNIYERFINRVENGDEDYDDIEDEPQSDKSHNRKADRDVDLKSTETTFDFSDSDQEASIKSAGPHTNKSFESSDLNDDTFGLDFDFANDDINAASRVPEPTVLSNTDETVHLLDGTDADDNSKLSSQDSSTPLAVQETALAQTKLASSKKPLILGMLLGSLLIGVVVAILIFTGVLSPSPQSDVSNSADTSTSSEVETPPATESAANVSNTPAPTAVDNVPSADTNPSNPPAVTSTPQQASPIKENQGATSNNAVEPATATLDTASNTEPAITYEDFREESQVTVYRETDD